MNCKCGCGCPVCAAPMKGSHCKSEEERQERIKASKRQYYQRNREKHVQYKRMYDANELPCQQPEQENNPSPPMVLKIVNPIR